MVKSMSIPTIRRLPAYHRLLRELREGGQEYVSAARLAEELRLDPVVARKDLASTGVVGRPRVGFMVEDLVTAIERYLGWNNTTNAFLVGAGNLGAALLGYRGFEQHGLRMVAAFDTDPDKVGRRIQGKPVYPLVEMIDLAQLHKVRLGVLTVPAPAAQDAAAIMILSGIRAIWNFTSAKLEVPPETIVENIDLSSSLAVLSNKLGALERV